MTIIIIIITKKKQEKPRKIYIKIQPLASKQMYALLNHTDTHTYVHPQLNEIQMTPTYDP